MPAVLQHAIIVRVFPLEEVIDCGVSLFQRTTMAGECSMGIPISSTLQMLSGRSSRLFSVGTAPSSVKSLSTTGLKAYFARTVSAVSLAISLSNLQTKLERRLDLQDFSSLNLLQSQLQNKKYLKKR